MAAVTVTSPKYTTWGDKQVLIASIAAVADADTLVPIGFGVVDVCMATADASAAVQPEISGTTITFNVSAGTPALTVVIIGS